MLSVAKSRYTLFAQFCFLVLNALGLLIGVVYNQRTPDFYEHNAHHPIGWIATWIASAWVVMGVVVRYAKPAGQYEPTPVANTTRYEQLSQQSPQSPAAPRWSNDSGQGTERTSESLYGHSRSGSLQDDMLPSHKYHDDADDDELLEGEPEKRSFLQNSRVDRFLSRTVPRFFVGRTVRVIGFCSGIIDRTILLLGFLAFTTGLVVFGGIAVSQICLASDVRLVAPDVVLTGSISGAAPCLVPWPISLKAASSSGTVF
jgi:hypothetical protein